MCGACEPVCPENLDIMALVRRLRGELHETNRNPFARPPDATPQREIETRLRRRLLLAGPDLERQPELLAGVIECLGGADRVRSASDDGRDLAWALETGAPVDEARIDRLVSTFEGARELIVIEGILHRFLRERCPGIRVRGLAEMLLDSESLLSTLGPRDYLVIDARAYNADQPRLVQLFDQLRSRTRCQMNLDLQRVAIPTGADSLQARSDGHASCETSIRWMFEGREFDRIVVESPTDLDALAEWTDRPVVHLSTLVSAARVR